MRAHDAPPMSKPKSPAANLSEYAKALMAGLQTIPVDELVTCARENLTATRRIRLSKDDPAGVEEPDYATRQKALQFITEQIAGSAATRKPVDLISSGDGEERVKPGELKPKA